MQRSLRAVACPSPGALLRCDSICRFRLRQIKAAARSGARKVSPTRCPELRLDFALRPCGRDAFFWTTWVKRPPDSRVLHCAAPISARLEREFEHICRSIRCAFTHGGRLLFFTLGSLPERRCRLGAKLSKA